MKEEMMPPPDAEVKCTHCEKLHPVKNLRETVGTEMTCTSCKQKFKVENPRLMPCPDCFQPISKRATTCPHCGCYLVGLVIQQEETITVCHPSLKGYFWQVILGIVLIPLVVGIFYLFWLWLKNKFTSYEITNLRIIVRCGFIAKRQTEIWIKDMRGVHLEQSFWERCFQIGNICIGTAATESTEICMIGISEPQKIVDQINMLRNRDIK